MNVIPLYLNVNKDFTLLKDVGPYSLLASDRQWTVYLKETGTRTRYLGTIPKKRSETSSELVSRLDRLKQMTNW